MMVSVIEHFFTEDYIVERNTPISNGMGGYKDAWATHLVIKAKIRPLTETEKYAADKLTLYATHKLYCKIIDIKEEDRVVDLDGNIYLVKGVINPMKFNNHLQVDLEYVRGYGE